jgi:hypothetical protein
MPAKPKYELEITLDLDAGAEGFNPFERMIARLIWACGFRRGIWTLSLRRASQIRSVRANAYWWGVVIREFQKYRAEQGEFCTAQECHDLLKLELLPPTVFISPVTQRTHVVPAETHNMTPEEFGRFIEAGVAWLAQMGIDVPPPQNAGILPPPRETRTLENAAN